ncbi:probable receptor-like protein kinase At2g42960 isoform X1 [Cryptomeria japonica]|uniref:probable receptor-like protein kinase At2g42960 isoform X1 n=1 Tax=Cryptomeria japonica TaxID=3369 RepID=UPI0027DA9930|nr:probable receptor-like protein kinase At2g42960 isoform X1 [Cryptomeria japonica]
MSRDLHSVICGEDDMIIDWPTRQNIILDIIRGVSYLQEGANECIAHRDIKPTNILLDENLNAKIGDFGLARILQPGDAKYANKEISTDGRVFLKDIYNFPSYETCSIFGTCGYVDPESRQTLIVTLKTDIYSFGVLLLNVVSGRPAMGTNESTLLSEQALKLLGEDRLTELIDPRLLDREGLINSSTILRTIKIALSCIEFDSERRPSVSQVLKMLSSEEEISIPTSPLLKR